METAKSEFKSAPRYDQKPAPVAGFIHLNENVSKILPRFYHYRNPRIVKGKSSWYIEYWYRIPLEIRHLYNNQEWHRFRFREDINKRRGTDREEYAEWLKNEITNSLKNGYNPFLPEIEYLEKTEKYPEQEKQKLLVAKDAIELFLEKWKERGLDKNSYAKYARYLNRFYEWLHTKRLLFDDIKNIKSSHIEAFLADLKKKYGFGNREYNNTYDGIRTAFNFWLKKKIIDESPMADVSKLRAKALKHRFFDDAAFASILKLLKAKDEYTLFAFQVVYYLCVRSEKELKYLKAGNINWSQNNILAEASGTKGSAERYIPLDNNIKDIFIKRGLDKANPNYYIFGIKGIPSSQPFGKGFFSKRFARIREEAGLPSWFTLYGAKHTRVIHLKQDHISDADIMMLTGHKDYTAFAKYLRDLGITADPEKINKVSRKI